MFKHNRLQAQRAYEHPNARQSPSLDFGMEAQGAEWPPFRVFYSLSLVMETKFN